MAKTFFVVVIFHFVLQVLQGALVILRSMSVLVTPARMGVLVMTSLMDIGKIPLHYYRANSIL